MEIMEPQNSEVWQRRKRRPRSMVLRRPPKVGPSFKEQEADCSVS